MKHCLILAPFVLSSAAAFTSVNRQFNNFAEAQTSLKASEYDYNGYNNRIEDAYKAWCRVYQKTDTSRLEIFAYHFLLAEEFFGQTGAPIKLNEFADLSSNEYLSLQGKGSLPEVAQPTGFVVSETKASDFAVPAPTAPAGYGPAGASYLEALSGAATAPSGRGMTSYLDTVPKNTAPSGGGGMTSYLDTMNGAAPADEHYYVPPPAAETVYTPPAPPSAPAAASTPYTPAESAAPVANSGNYMDNLSSTSAGSPRGTGMTSYLDTVPANGAVSGAGLTSYLDGVGKAGPAAYTPFEAPATPAAATPEPYVPPPAQPYVPSAPAAPVATTGNYMDNLSSASSTSATRGAGMTSYLDTVRSSGAAPGGTGMASYLENMGTAQPSAVEYGSPSAPPVAPAAPEVTIEPAAVEPIYFQPFEPVPLPPPSRNIPGSHWMDTVTPITSYGSRGVINGNWAEENAYQAANTRYQTSASASASLVQEQVAPDHFIVKEKDIAEPARSTQEGIMPAVRRQVQETFGGSFIVN